MKNFQISKVLCGAVFSIAAGVAMTANADNYSETYVSTTAEGLRSISVSYADLDLSDQEGRNTLDRRVSSAAEKVCGPSNYRQAGSLRQATENRSCYRDAMADGMKQTSSEQIAVIGN
jgi:UrcA family protein